MKTIILAGGKATRLSQSAKDIPKALVKVGQKPILQHQIDWLKSHGIKDKEIKLSLGFKANEIIDYLAGKHDYVVEKEPLGTGGAIKFTSKGFKEPFLVLNGDILTDLNLSKFIDVFKESSFPNMHVISKVANYEGLGVVMVDSGSTIKFLEKPDFENKKSSEFINVGVYILSPNIFNGVDSEFFMIEKDIFPKISQEGMLGNFVHNGFFQDLGTEERLRKTRRTFNL